MSTLTHDVWRACANPRRAMNGLHRLALLAHHAGLSYGDVLRYRRELLDDEEFQTHIAQCLADVPYVFPGAAEVYVVVRSTKPRVVVETGVASGLSSAHILRALAANGSGRLYSIDLPNVQAGSILPEGRTTGWAVPDPLRARWELELGDARKLLPKLLGALDRVDLFLHDSDHSYEHMSFEFGQALPKLAQGALLMSDDIHLHAAWDDFCTTHGLRATRIGHVGVTQKRSCS